MDENRHQRRRWRTVLPFENNDLAIRIVWLVRRSIHENVGPGPRSVLSEELALPGHPVEPQAAMRLAVALKPSHQANVVRRLHPNAVSDPGSPRRSRERDAFDHDKRRPRQSLPVTEAGSELVLLPIARLVARVLLPRERFEDLLFEPRPPVNEVRPREEVVAPEEARVSFGGKPRRESALARSARPVDCHYSDVAKRRSTTHLIEQVPDAKRRHGPKVAAIVTEGVPRERA
jgi:hypothetical protein